VDTISTPRAAIDRWIGCGFRIVSLNVPPEFENLRDAFPDIHFILVQRYGKQQTGGPLVYLDDLLTHLATLGGDLAGMAPWSLVVVSTLNL
jgi:hypothetical protein